VARFVPQSISPSTNPRTRARTAYLAPLRSEVESIIRNYYAARPEGEDVTLAVLREIGDDRLRAIGGRRDFDTLKKDAGLYVPIVLVEMFSAEHVLTYRSDDGQVSTRAANGDPPWVNKFTPHRVIHDRPERIVLDTNVVRNLLEEDPAAIDLAELAAFKGSHPISIADPAWAELVKALLSNRIGFEAWSKHMAAVSDVLDPVLPIVPSGQEAAAMAGISDERDSPALPDAAKSDIGHLSAYYRAVWHYVASASSAEHFGSHVIFESPRGEHFKLGPLTLDKVTAAFDDRAMTWSAFLSRLRVSDGSQPPNLDDVAEDIRASLAVGMPKRNIDQLDLVIRVIARLAINVNRRTTPPDTNEAIDLDVLFSTMLPAIVCTSDRKMLSAARECGSGSAWRVMDPPELLSWLRARHTPQASTPARDSGGASVESGRPRVANSRVIRR
jgi:hypothetical protein